MVLSAGVQIRRPHGREALRKPSTSSHTFSTTSPTPIKNTSSDNLAVNELKIKLLALNEDTIVMEGDVVKKDVLSSLNKGILTTRACLKVFLETAWKDRNRDPVIAKIFHEITQDYDDESTTTGLTAMLEKCCNDLLNILTLLGKPEVGDLSIVTLLANLYRLEDLPEEHREGVESYLIDIAKAFWPYFVPQKHEVWDDELVSDAICDVFNTIGQILEIKCPVNMERTFNKITTMLFSMNNISKYTRLRLMEVKECRAAGWTLPLSAKAYYRAAYLKHSRSSLDSSTKSISPSSLCSSEKDFLKSSAENSSSTTATTSNLLNDLRYEITVSRNTTMASEKPSKSPVVVRIKEKPQNDKNNNNIDVNVKSPLKNKSVETRKGLGAAISCSEEKGIPQILKEESTTFCFNFPSPTSEDKKIPTPTNNGLQTKTNALETKFGGFESPNVSDYDMDSLVHKFEECSLETSKDKKSPENKSQSTNDLNLTNISPDTIPVASLYKPPQPEKSSKPEKFLDTTSGKTSSNGISFKPTGGFGTPGDYTNTSPNAIPVASLYKNAQPEKNLKPEKFFDTANSYKPSGGFGTPGNHFSSLRNKTPKSAEKLTSPENNMAPNISSTDKENCPSAGNSSNRNTSLPRGFSFPETLPSPSSLHFDFNDSSTRKRLSSTGHTCQPFNRYGGLRRTQSESANVELNYHCGQENGNIDGGRFSSYRPNYQRQTSNERLPWKSNLEFPVKDVLDGEDLNPSSRLYLLSFAITPAALERPLDLTLTPEVETEKGWLKDVILKETKTVLDRFG